MHKIGIHVTGSDRTNYGMAAPRAVAITSMDDPSAFDEAPDEAIKIHRTQRFSDHKDAPGDFDRIAYADLHEAGRYWYGKMRREILPVVNEYPNCYFQPTNEINNKRIIPYLRGFVEAAELDGVKIALLGDAAGSPDRLEWLEHWVPFLQEMSDRGHIYVRHVYSGLPHDRSTTNNKQLSDYLTDRNATPLPADSNAARPFWEAQQLRDKGIRIPILITELGWRAGWNDLPFAWITDLIAYNELMLAHDNIIGCCVWNAGQWENAPNILSGRPLADIAAIMATNTPVFFDPDAVIAPAPPLPVEPNEPTQPAPRFSLDYISTAVLFPQDVPLLKLFDLPQWADVVQEMDAKRRSMFWSHHDAIAAVVAGLPGSKLIIYGNRKEAEQLAADYEIPFEVRPIPTKPEPITVPTDPEPVIVSPTPEPEPSGEEVDEPFAFKAWPTEYKVITQAYGVNPTYYAQFGLPGHEGVDIRALHGTEIRTVADGTVSRVYDNPKKKDDGGHNYGIHVRVVHKDGYQTIYAHLDRRVVNAGDVVEAGQLLGYADNTGNSFGSHLHLTLKRDNKIIDPMPFVNALLKELEEEDDPAPTPQPKPVAKKYDVLDYMLGGDGKQYMVNVNGPQERYRYDHINGGYYIVKNSQWERYMYDGNYIYSDTDTSPDPADGHDRYYVVRSLNGSLSQRCPRYMSVGQSWVEPTPHWVQFYDKKTGKPLDGNSGQSSNTAQFIAKGAWQSPHGPRFEDTITLKLGTETHIYARGIGRVGWSASWGMAGATSEDVNGQTPYIREVVATPPRG